MLGGADRDWVNLLNALGPENVRVTWVGNTGSEQLRKYLDDGVLVRAIDLEHPCFYWFVLDNVHAKRSLWLWTKIVVASSIGLTRSSLRLRRALRGDRVDIVVTNTVVPLLGAVFALFSRRPHLWTVKEYLDPRLRPSRRYAAFITRSSAAVVVPSLRIGEAFVDRAHLLPDGADIDDIASRVTSSRDEVLARLGLPTDVPMVVHAGVVSHRKGQHLTAEAFVRLADGGGPPPCSLAFFGIATAADKEEVARVLTRLPDAWRAVVRFDVFRDGDLSPLAAADIVVHPSTFHDAFPNGVREAMTLGKPVIASSMGGMVDMIEDGEDGVLIAPGDAAALASALEELIRLPELRRRLGAHAAESARRQFDIHERKVPFLDLLHELAGR